MGFHGSLLLPLCAVSPAVPVDLGPQVPPLVFANVSHNNTAGFPTIVKRVCCVSRAIGKSRCTWARLYTETKTKGEVYRRPKPQNPRLRQTKGENCIRTQPVCAVPPPLRLKNMCEFLHAAGGGDPLGALGVSPCLKVR